MRRVWLRQILGRGSCWLLHALLYYIVFVLFLCDCLLSCRVLYMLLLGFSYAMRKVELRSICVLSRLRLRNVIKKIGFFITKKMYCKIDVSNLDSNFIFEMNNDLQK